MLTVGLYGIPDTTHGRRPIYTHDHGVALRSWAQASRSTTAGCTHCCATSGKSTASRP